MDASWSDRPLGTKTRIFQATLGGLVRGFIAVSFMSFGCSDFALGEDADGSAKTTALPNIYLDLRTTYATVPANTLSIGLGDTSVFTTLSNIARFIRPTTLPTAPTLSSPASQNVALDVPLTVDVSDRISLYGGFTGSATHTDISGWSTLAISSWFVR